MKTTKKSTRQIEPVPVILVVIGAAVGLIYALYFDMMQQIPLIFGYIGAAVGFIYALFYIITEGWKNALFLVVAPMLFLLGFYVLGWLVVLLYSLFFGG